MHTSSFNPKWTRIAPSATTDFAVTMVSFGPGGGNEAAPIYCEYWLGGGYVAFCRASTTIDHAGDWVFQRKIG
jgi:hypothetical protein